MSNNEPKNPNNEFIDFTKKLCPYAILGNLDISVTTYFCLTCDPRQQNPICKGCTKSCHKDCTTEQYNKGTLLFSCNCGKNKHIVKPKIEKKELSITNTKCSIKPLSCLKENFYQCYNCNKTACFVCIDRCHKDCGTYKLQALEGDSHACECVSPIHLYNSFLIDDYLSYHDYRFSKLLSLNQLIYLQCESGGLDSLLDMFKYPEKHNFYIYELSERLVGIFLDEKFASKTLCLYHPRLVNALSIANIYERILANDDKNFQKFIYYFIIYNYHLRNDFQGVKKFSAYDYLNSSMKDRYEIGQIFRLSIPEEIQKKYSIFKFNSNSGFVNKMFLLVNASLDKMKFERFPRDDIVKLVKLKILYYSLIFQMFNINELISLVSKLFQNFSDFFDTNDFDNEKEKQMLPNTYNYLIKIFYVICINYNDLVYQEQMKGNKNYTFIHSNNDIGTILLKMILKLNTVIHFTTDTTKSNFSRSMVIFYNEIISLFTLSENKYSKDLSRTPQLEIIKGLDIKTNIYPILKQFETELEELKRNVLLNNEPNVFRSFYDKAANFLRLLATVSNSQSKNSKTETKYSLKVKTFIAKFFPEANNITFENIKGDLSLALRITNVLENILKIFAYAGKTESSAFKPIEAKELEAVISLTLLLNLNREGTLNLVSGKLLAMVPMISPELNNFMFEYYHLLFKGISIYKVKFTYNKSLLQALCKVISFLGNPANYGQDNYINLIRCFKILSSQAYNYDFEVFKYPKLFVLKNLDRFVGDFSDVFAYLKENNQAANFEGIRAKMTKELLKQDSEKVPPREEKESLIRKKTLIPLILYEQEHNSSAEEVVGNNNKLTLNKLSDLLNKKNNTGMDEAAQMFIKLYTALFNFLTANLNYTMKNESLQLELSKFEQMLKLNDFKLMLSENYLSLNQRTAFLKYVVGIYLLPVINGNIELTEVKQYDSDLFSEEILTTEQYFYFISNNDEKRNELNEIFNGSFSYINYDANLGNLNYLNKVSEIIEIMCKEFDNLVILVYNSLDKGDRIYEYVNFLVDFVKYISDYFIAIKGVYGLNFSNHMTIEYYKIAEKFLSCYNIISKLSTYETNYKQIKNDLLIGLNKQCLDNEYLTELKNIKDYFDMPSIYKAVRNALVNINPQLKKPTSFEKHLIKYDNLISKEYFSKNLIPKGDYQIFYQNNKTLCRGENKIYNNYLTQFKNIDNTNLMLLLNTINDEDELFYKRILVEYFIHFTLSRYHISEDFDIAILKIITKLLYYNNKTIQTCFNNIQVTDDIIGNLFIDLKKLLIIIAQISSNCLVAKRYSKYVKLKAILIIRLLQSLGDNYCEYFVKRFMDELTFCPKPEVCIRSIYPSPHFIFSEEPPDGTPEAQNVYICKTLGDSLFYFLQHMNLRSQLPLYLPNDDYITLTSAIISFLSEFQLRDNPSGAPLVGLVSRILFDKAKIENPPRENINIFTKIRLLKLVNSYINGDKSVKHHIKEIFSVVKIFEEIFGNMKKLLKDTEKLELIGIRTLYVFNDLDNCPEMRYSITLFKFLKLLEVKYGMLTIHQYFKENRELLKTKKNTDERSIYSKLGLFIYDFFTEIVPKVEIRYLKEVKEGSDEEPKYLTQNVFFVKSSLTYLLSEQTRQVFLDTVDRSSGSKKVTALLDNAYYFLFEMFYNHDHMVRSRSWLSLLFKNLKFEYCEVMNYMLIIIHQIVLLNFYTQKAASDGSVADFTDTEKFKENTANIDVGIIQAIWLVLVLFIWIKCYLPLLYQRLIMNENMNLLFGDASRFSIKFGDNFISENKQVVSNLSKEVSFIKWLRIIILDIVVFNRSINMLVANLILLILYFSTNNSIFLIIPVLFIASMSILLTDIVFAIRLKWKQLALVILFTYLLVYFFSWIGFLYLYKLYSTDVVDASGTTSTENMCSSAFQCWINSINYGVRAGGGIGDALPKASFFQSSETFAKLFVFNISFHIIIVLILGNIFLGVIVDTFAELRDEKQKFENDSNNVCFICQLSREASSAKMINFDEHIEKDHNVWNYLDFIVYLLLNKPNNFNKLELEAYKSLKEHSTMWIPDNS
jgi:hypothetical protein